MNTQPTVRELLLELQAELKDADNLIRLDVQSLGARIQRLEDMAARSDASAIRAQEDIEQIRLLKYELEAIKQHISENTEERRNVGRKLVEAAIAAAVGMVATILLGGWAR